MEQMNSNLCSRLGAIVIALSVVATVSARNFYVPGAFQGWDPPTSQLMVETAPMSGIYSTTITGLVEGSQYGFKILEDLSGDGANWSEWIHFHTASQEPDPFTFVYFGDAQNDIKSHWSRVIREAYRDAPKAAFFLHAGDLVDVANRDAQWGHWFGAGGFIHAMTPCVATPGNHEYSQGLSRHWRKVFSLPLNGPAGLEETVYYVDHPGGSNSNVFPVNALEAESRRAARFSPIGYTGSTVRVRDEVPHADYPLTLDLRFEAGQVIG